ncbi:MAG TPA: hypothetical protein VKR83_08685, partial [Ktedonobacteraceae bacterium]|nr:hypothetical protein [Ktedonobacteraceae bacterium]
ARVAPTIHGRNAQPYIVGAGLAPALGAARVAAIDSILEFLNLTLIGRGLAPALVLCCVRAQFLQFCQALFGN